MEHLEEKLSSEELFRGHVVHLTRDTVRLENGKSATREVVWHQGASAVVPMDEDGNVYMVRQYRYPVGRETLEIPAGKIDPGEDPQTAARRELEEECGLTAETWTSLGAVYPTVGYSSEVIHLYLAKNLKETAVHPDEDEFVTIERHPLKGLVDLVMAGTIMDSKTVAAILKAARI